MEVGAVQAEWYGVVRGSYRRSRVAARGHASAGVHFRTRACGLAAGRQRTQASERARASWLEFWTLCQRNDGQTGYLFVFE